MEIDLKQKARSKYGSFLLLAVGVVFVGACQKKMTSAPLANIDSHDGSQSFAQGLSLAEESFDRETYIARANELKDKIKTRLPGLEQKRDQKSALINEMIVESAYGCWGSVKLKDVVISFEGKKHPRQRIANGSPKTSSANPDITSFMLGEDLAISNNEKNNAIFSPIGEIKKTDLGSYKISDITSLRVVQAGAGFENRRVCDGGGLFDSEDCEHENWETAIREMQTLKIIVNGAVLYEKKNINHIFREGKLSWKDLNFKTNDAYIDLMARTDCPAD